MHIAAFPAHPKHTCCLLLLLISIHRLDAQVWESITSGFPTTTFRAVHFPTDLDGWAVGDAGRVLRSTNGGATWTDQTANAGASANTLYGVYFLNNTTGWVVGGRGTIRKTTNGGTTLWTMQNATTFTDLYDVRFSSATNGVIVGACGLILHTANGGSQWTQVSSGEAYNITKVRLLPTGQGVAATSGALLLYTTDGGMHWDTAAGSNLASNFRGLDLAADGTAYAVSMTGAVLRSTDFGVSWMPAAAMPVGGNWQALSLIPSGEVWAGGFNNTVFRNNNGAATVWQQAYTNIAGTDVYGLHFRDALRGWAVGSNGKIFRTCLRAAFSFAVNGKTVTFTNTSSGASSYTWTFGDGNGSTAVEPVYTYAAGNTYTVTLKATGPCGMDSAVLVVNTSPTPGFTANPVNGCVAAAIQFSNTSSANATSFTWYFSGGTPAQSNLPNPSVTYAAPGTYDVRLVARNSLGLADSVTKMAYITISQPPAPGFTAAVNFQTATFANTSTGATGYTWDFGDGQNSALTNPVHAYAANGTYIVQLTATNTCGSSVFSDTLQIDGRPNPNFTTSTSTGCAPFMVQFTDQTTGAPTSYEWSFPGGTPSTATAASPSVTYAAPGTYSATLIASNAFGKDTITKTNIIQVNTVTAGASAASPVCPGATISLQATGGNTYAWTGPAGFSASQQNPQRPNAAANMAGTYTVTVTDSNTGCTATASATVSVSAPVNAAISTPGGLELNCSKISLSLTASGGGTYSWSGGLGTNASATVTAPGTYTVLVTSAATGCTETATATVTKDVAIPVVSAVGDTLNCNQTSVVLDGNSTTPNVTYLWTGPNSFSSALSDPAVGVAGTYTLLVSAPNGCTASAQAVVDGVPGSPGAAAAGDTLTCSSLNVQLSGNSTFSNVAYSWTGPGGFTSNQQNPVASAPGTYTLKVTDMFGCTGTATATVIDDRTPPAVSATGGTLKCQPLMIKIGISTNAPSPLYVWTGPGGFTSNQQMPDVSQPGVYTVTVINSQNNCSATATAVVNPAPVVQATIGVQGGTVITCANKTVVLQASGGNQFKWSPPLGDSAQVSVSVAGVYTVTVTDATSGCTATASRLVTVDTLSPVIVTNGGVRTCANSFVILSCSGLSPGDSIRWSGPTQFISNEQNPKAFATGIYVVTVTGSNGCIAIDTAEVMGGDSLPNISAIADTIFCGQPAHLHGSSSTPGVTPLWKGPNGFNAAVFDTATTVSGLYFFTVTLSTNGCSSTAVVQVTSAPAPMPKIIGPDQFCPGDSALLSVSEGYKSYLWSTGETARAIVVKNPGTYSVTIVDQHDCVDSDMKAVNHFLKPLAQLALQENSGLIADDAVICAGDKVTLTASGGLFYQFFINNEVQGPPSLNGKRDFSLQQTATLSVQLSDNNGCIDATNQGEGPGKQSILVIVNPVPAATVLIRTICQGESVTVGTVVHDQSGLYTQTLESSAGCDSVVVLNLTVSNQVSKTEYDTICAGTSYPFNGQLLTASGMYFTILPGVSGCDTAFTLKLTVLPELSTNIQASICPGQSFIVGDTAISKPGKYVIVLKTTQGCDSVVHLLLLPATAPVFSLGPDLSRCVNSPAFTLQPTFDPGSPCINCTYLWSTGETDPQITVKPTATTTYSLKITDQSGCTATQSVHALVQTAYDVTIDTVLCKGDSLFWFGEYLRAAGTRVKKLKTQIGECDSTVTLHVTLNEIAARDDRYCVAQHPAQTELRITDNDLYPPDWQLSILQAPGKGMVEVVGQEYLRYQPREDTVGWDTLSYVLCGLDHCPESCDTATVILAIMDETVSEMADAVPNGFLPDGGFAENQIFDPIASLCQHGFRVDPVVAEFTILNRWGEIIFQRKAGAYTAWDGRNGNGYFPSGTYYYRLAFSLENKAYELKGAVALLR